jgi:hypothetical protein
MSYHAEWIVCLISRRNDIAGRKQGLQSIDRILLRHIRAMFNDDWTTRPVTGAFFRPFHYNHPTTLFHSDNQPACARNHTVNRNSLKP